MKRLGPDDLLKEVFSDRELDALRENSLRQGLAAQRNKRRRRAWRTGVVVVAPVTALALLWLRPEPGENLPTAAFTRSPAAATPRIKIYAATDPANVPPVPTISDEELFALLADHPVGLIGQPGQQQLMVFDQPGSGASL